MGHTPVLDVSRAPKQVVSLLAGFALGIMMVRAGIARKQATRDEAEEQSAR